MINSTELVSRLNAHPELKSQIEKLLILAETNIVTRADDIEIAVSEIIPDLAKQTITDWGVKQQEIQSTKIESSEIKIIKNGKKK